MIILKNSNQIGKMRDAGKILYEVLTEVKAAVKPGVSTEELDELAEKLIRKNHAIPSSLNYQGFPKSICASVNDMVVHGIPSREEILAEGDIVSIDCTLLYDGWQSDSCVTVGVGNISEEAAKLIRVTEECFFIGARNAITGNRLGDIGHAVEEHAVANGFQPIRDYTGHGIGREMHEDPSVYNFGQAGRGLRLRRGMTLAVEPMIVTGDWHIRDLDDGWGVKTRDGGLCSHYEHTIAITDNGLPELLTLPGFTWEEAI
ncbi:MAG: type I methionyl aminopeptidase [Clostridia bacterium]|nr:type I methionyl aminopeptidase [Clostridia bacterium]